LNLLKSFQDRRDWAYSVFKTGEIGRSHFSKVAGAVLSAFQERIFNRKHIWRFKNQQD
jgi:hypothetical protein